MSTQVTYFSSGERGCSDEREEMNRPRVRGPVQSYCHHCGIDLGLRMPTDSGLHFCIGHHAAFRHEECIRKQCGRFIEPYKLYERFAVEKYSNGILAAGCVWRFLGFLNTKTCVQTIDGVTVDHVGQYIAWMKEKGKEPCLSLIKVFFDFMFSKGFIKRNPVRADLHYKRQHRNEPRVYSDAEIKEHLTLLESRGDAQTRAIYFTGFEAGPTIAQFCNLQIADVDLDKHVLHFRDPNARDGDTLYSHWAPIGDESVKWLGRWLAERRKDCGHNYVFVNKQGRRMTPWALNDLMNAVLLRKSKFREYADGVEKFSLDTLRDTNIWQYRKGKLDDTMSMRIHGIRAVETMKRFNMIMTDREVEDYLKAVSPRRQKTRDAGGRKNEQ